MSYAGPLLVGLCFIMMLNTFLRHYAVFFYPVDICFRNFRNAPMSTENFVTCYLGCSWVRSLLCLWIPLVSWFYSVDFWIRIPCINPRAMNWKKDLVLLWNSFLFYSTRSGVVVANCCVSTLTERFNAPYCPLCYSSPHYGNTQKILGGGPAVVWRWIWRFGGKEATGLAMQARLCKLLGRGTSKNGRT